MSYTAPQDAQRPRAVYDIQPDFRIDIQPDFRIDVCFESLTKLQRSRLRTLSLPVQGTT